VLRLNLSTRETAGCQKAPSLSSTVCRYCRARVRRGFCCSGLLQQAELHIGADCGVCSRQWQCFALTKADHPILVITNPPLNPVQGNYSYNVSSSRQYVRDDKKSSCHSIAGGPPLLRPYISSFMLLKALQLV